MQRSQFSDARRGGLSQGRDQPGDVLCAEEEVRWDDGVRDEADARA